MKAMILITTILASSFANAQILKCQEQVLAQRETKNGFSTSLKGVPAKDKPATYLVNGKASTKEYAVAYAIKNMKPIITKR